MNKEIFAEKLYSKYPKEDLFLVEYASTKNSCKIKCKTCGKIYTFKKTENALQPHRKYICKECGQRDKIRKSFEQSLNAIFSNEPIELLEFTTPKRPAVFKCPTCNFVFSLGKAEDVKSRKHFCPLCHPYIQEDLQKAKEVFIKTNKNWELISFLDNIHSEDLIECKCKKCGKINSKTLYEYLNGVTCSCSYWRTKDNFLKALGTEYKIIDNNVSIKKRIKIRHECGFIYEINPSLFLSGGSRCPKCEKKHLKGVKAISKLLKENNIEYEANLPIFQDGHLRKIDFYLPKQNLYIIYGEGKNKDNLLFISNKDLVRFND